MEYDELIATARKATEFSYAPYSGFRVGAAALTADGGVITGCNVENAAYAPTVCAERVAMFAAVAQGRLPIAAIAIATPSGATCTPCGTCRQVIWELARDADIVMEDGRGGIFVKRIEALFPQPFGYEDLGVDPAKQGAAGPPRK